MSEKQQGMGEWRDISTAPKNSHVLLFGSQQDTEYEVSYLGPLVFSGYWDSLDNAWCCTGSTWTGPFFEPTHWMSLPEPPKELK